MKADNRQSPNTPPLSQEKSKKADSKDSKLKTLDNEQLDQITGGAGGQMQTSDTSSGKFSVKSPFLR